MDIGSLIEAANAFNPIGWIKDQFNRGQARDENRTERQEDYAYKDKEYERQKEFAQNTIGWRVEDARRSGIHPLAALGASGSGYAPSGGVGLTNIGPGDVSSSGHDTAPKSSSEALTDALLKAQIENVEMATEGQRLQNERYTFENFNLSAKPIISGQADSTVITPKVVSGSEAEDKKRNAERGFSVDHQGNLYVMPSKDVKELIEDSPYEWEHWIRNRLLPVQPDPSSDHPPPPGMTWEFDYIQGRYKPVPIENSVSEWKRYQNRLKPHPLRRKKSKLYKWKGG